jgi:hypothetical protein
MISDSIKRSKNPLSGDKIQKDALAEGFRAIGCNQSGRKYVYAVSDSIQRFENPLSGDKIQKDASAGCFRAVGCNQMG